MDTHVIGAALATSAALPRSLTEVGRGRPVPVLHRRVAHAVLAGVPAYHVSKAALEKLVEAFRVEHPSVGFTRFVVGDCAGGEGDCRTGFNDGWDREYAAQVRPTRSGGSAAI